jgi:hypothetical protein
VVYRSRHARIEPIGIPEASGEGSERATGF